MPVDRDKLRFEPAGADRYKVLHGPNRIPVGFVQKRHRHWTATRNDGIHISHGWGQRKRAAQDCLAVFLGDQLLSH